MTRITVAMIVAGTLLPLSAQWLNYPTAGVPKLANGKPNLAAPTPRAADGKPDLSGLWEADVTVFSSSPVAGAAQLPPEFTNIGARLKGGLPYRPWARDLLNARKAANGKDGPDGKCLPINILQKHSHPYPRKMIQVPGFIAILYEKNIEYRQIFTDGRPLPKDPQPSFHGYSSGKWEGDTLVVDTIGFHEDTWADAEGNVLTEAAKVTERFRRPNYGNLEIEITVNDPKAYTAPWTVKINQHIVLDTDLLEYSCVENEKDLSHLVGK